LRKISAPDEIARTQMTEFDELAHLDVRDRPVPLAVPGDKPLDYLRRSARHAMLIPAPASLR
jgi:hypothetical protein